MGGKSGDEESAAPPPPRRRRRGRVVTAPLPLRPGTSARKDVHVSPAAQAPAAVEALYTYARERERELYRRIRRREGGGCIVFDNGLRGVEAADETEQ